MFHRKTPRPWYAATAAVGLAALAFAAAPVAAQQGSAPQGTAPQPATTAHPATPTAPDSAKPAVRKSRFGRFGQAFQKAANTAAEAGAKAGISRETAARLAVTAATGGAAAALLSAKQQSTLSAANMASHALAAPSVAPARARLAGAPVDTATAAAAVRAMTELGQISVRAQQHDPAAMRAIQALNAAMAKPDAQFTALQHRATAGDPTAAQQIIIREAAIAHAALGGSAP